MLDVKGKRFLEMITRGNVSLLKHCSDAPSSLVDFRFALTPPSMIAAAAICVAFHGLNKSIGLVCPTRQELISMMHDITGAEEVGDYFFSRYSTSLTMLNCC